MNDLITLKLLESLLEVKADVVILTYKCDGVLCYRICKSREEYLGANLHCFMDESVDPSSVLVRGKIPPAWVE